ncbi:MAG: hypothetical protein WC505_07570 [Patescibacteria group bacterium]
MSYQNEPATTTELLRQLASVHKVMAGFQHINEHDLMARCRRVANALLDELGLDKPLPAQKTKKAKSKRRCSSIL